VLGMIRAGRPKLPKGQHQMVLHCACENWAGADSKYPFKMIIQEPAAVPEVSATSPGEEDEDEYEESEGDSDEEDDEEDDE